MSSIQKINFTEIDENPHAFLSTKKITEKKLQKILEKASSSYYETSKELISDATFDILKDYLEDNYPNNPFLKQIGADVAGSQKVKLPFHMGSMDKKKKSKDIQNWIQKYPLEVLISDKLDGISFLLVIKNGKGQLLTRGNGTYGKDISQIIPHLKLPKLSNLPNITVRGEMLVSQNNFKKVKDKFSNGRSFVAGLSNFKELTEARVKYLSLVDLVCYELVEPNLKTESQMKFLSKNGFQVVPYHKKTKITYELLQEILLDRKEKSIYDIDGIIVTSNQVNPKTLSGNPKYSFAFKMDLEFAITEVLRVEWNASKHGKLKPIVIIKPVYLNGTLNSKATGNNADFIEKNKIGKGAKVKIIKGGEIIPKIEEVIKPTQADFPKIDYVWNSTHKEILLANLENDDRNIKILVSFFKTIGVENLGIGLISKLYQHNINTIQKICLLEKEDLLKLDGIKDKSADKIIQSIRIVIDKPIKLEKIISGSCVLGDGLGEKILNKIFNFYQIKKIGDLDRINLPSLISIEGIEEKTANKIMLGIPKIKKFMLVHSYLKFIPYNKSKKNKTENKGKLEGLNIVLSGKRDSDIMSFISQEGGQIKTTVNKNTSLLVVDNLDLETSKIKTAHKLNVKIIESSEFKKTFINK